MSQHRVRWNALYLALLRTPLEDTSIELHAVLKLRRLWYSIPPATLHFDVPVATCLQRFCPPVSKCGRSVSLGMLCPPPILQRLRTARKGLEICLQRRQLQVCQAKAFSSMAAFDIFSWDI
jgi:hypothetical protein